MIRVFISSPYSLGDYVVNIDRQKEAATILIDLGYNPFWPLSSHYLNEWKEQPYETWMKLDLDWIGSCDCVLRLPGESKGADREVEHAKKIGMPVFHSILELTQNLQPTRDYLDDEDDTTTGFIPGSIPGN